MDGDYTYKPSFFGYNVIAQGARDPCEGGEMKKAKYTVDMPRRLYTYFVGYSGIGAPSLSKFARENGITLADVKRFRDTRAEFRRACEECSEIRRDYLIDNALGKKQDAAMTRFILSAEFGMGEDAPDEDARRLEVTVEVIGDEA